MKFTGTGNFGPDKAGLDPSTVMGSLYDSIGGTVIVGPLAADRHAGSGVFEFDEIDVPTTFQRGYWRVDPGDGSDVISSAVTFAGLGVLLFGEDQQSTPTIPAPGTVSGTVVYYGYEYHEDGVTPTSGRKVDVYLVSDTPIENTAGLVEQLSRTVKTDDTGLWQVRLARGTTYRIICPQSKIDVTFQATTNTGVTVVDIRTLI